MSPGPDTKRSSGSRHSPSCGDSRGRHPARARVKSPEGAVISALRCRPVAGTGLARTTGAGRGRISVGLQRLRWQRTGDADTCGTTVVGGAGDRPPSLPGEAQVPDQGGRRLTNAISACDAVVYEIVHGTPREDRSGVARPPRRQPYGRNELIEVTAGLWPAPPSATTSRGGLRTRGPSATAMRARPGCATGPRPRVTSRTARHRHARRGHPAPRPRGRRCPLAHFASDNDSWSGAPTPGIAHGPRRPAVYRAQFGDPVPGGRTGKVERKTGGTTSR